MTEYGAGMLPPGFRSELKRPSPEVIEKLKEVSAATAWAMLNRFSNGRGDDYFLEHVHPIHPMNRAWAPGDSTEEGGKPRTRARRAP